MNHLFCPDSIKDRVFIMLYLLLTHLGKVFIKSRIRIYTGLSRLVILVFKSEFKLSLVWKLIFLFTLSFSLKSIIEQAGLLFLDLFYDKKQITLDFLIAFIADDIWLSIALLMILIFAFEAYNKSFKLFLNFFAFRAIITVTEST